MDLKRFYVFYSLIFFAIFVPVFIFFYLLKIFSEEELKNRIRYGGYGDDLMKCCGGLGGGREGLSVKKINGGFNNCLVKVSINGFGGYKKFLFKKYVLFGSFFTLWGNWFAPYGNFRKVSANLRMENEIYFSRLLRDNGINAPKILKQYVRDKVIVMDFIEGEKMDQVDLNNELLREAGSVVARIHSMGIYMNDNTPCNFILKDNNIYIVDLEGFSRKGNRAWDLANFIFWLGSNGEGINSFMKGYKEEMDRGSGSAKKIIEKELKDALLSVSSYGLIFRLGSYFRRKI